MAQTIELDFGVHVAWRGVFELSGFVSSGVNCCDVPRRVVIFVDPSVAQLVESFT